MFSERVTAGVRELISFRNVIPRGAESRLEVRLDDGRTTSTTATVVGTNPKRYGIEVKASTEGIDAYPLHIDPGPADYVGGGD